MSQALQYAAGIVHYGADPGLARCLASLRAQSLPPQHVVVVDHDPPGAGSLDRDALRRAFPEVEWVHAANGGYAAGANRVIQRALGAAPSADFVLVLNPDVELEVDFATEALAALADRPRVALASGKLLRPSDTGGPGETGGRQIDSAGISMRRSRRFRDRGSEEPDDGRFDMIETVFAVSGAALLLRRISLPMLAVEGEIFDEDFFTYHEDTDLAWRARRLGWECLYVPRARATHVRGWRQGGRRGVATRIRRHSWKNRYLELLKNDSPLGFLRDLPFILPFEVARLGYALLADRALLGAYREAGRHARRALQKRSILRRRVRAIERGVAMDGTAPRVAPSLSRLSGRN